VTGRGIDPGFDLNRQIGAVEARADEDLSVIRLLETQWDRYRYAMREHAARFEHVASGPSARNYFVQRRFGIRRELDSFIGQLADEQESLCTEAVREIHARCDAESEQLRRAYYDSL